jgi:hypothetical protein
MRTLPVAGVAASLRRPLLLAAAILLTTDYSRAQASPEPTATQCQLIRLAVAQFGYAAARRHALETYGAEAVKTGDKCFTKQERAGR